MLFELNIISGCYLSTNFGVDLTLQELFNRDIDFSHVSGVLTNFQPRMDREGNTECYEAHFIIDSDVKGYDTLHFKNWLYETEIDSRVLFYPDFDNICSDNDLDCGVVIKSDFLHGIDVLSNPQMEIRATLTLSEDTYRVRHLYNREEILFHVTNMTIVS